MKTCPIHLAVLSLLGPMAAAPAWAQSSDAADNGKAETVVVTGQGRSQQLQTVPIAIQVLGGEQIRKLGAGNLGDLETSIPGLNVDGNQPTQPRLSMRGIGTSDFGVGTDSPVGIYIDGVYAGKSGGALVNFNDVKRIELLKGPQGTLFGRNSAAGAISVVTNDPVAKPAGQGLVRLGSAGLRHLEALVNQPLSETLSLRASVVSHHRDGFVQDAATGQRAGGEGAWGAKLALKWQLGDDTTALLSYEHEKLDQRARPAFGMIAATNGALPFPPDSQTFINPRNAPLLNDVVGDREARDFDGLTLRIEHSLPWAEFKSTTTYRGFNAVNRQDNDGTNNPTAYFGSTNLERNKSWSQEFRLSGKTSSVDWIAGLSFFQEHVKQSMVLDATTTSLNTLLATYAGSAYFSDITGLAQLLGVPGVNLLGHDWQEIVSNEGRFGAKALFGDAIWRLGARTNLTTGLRLTRDDKRFSWYNPVRTATTLDQHLAQTQLWSQLAASGALSPDEVAGLQALLGGNIMVATSGATTQPLLTRHSWTDVSPRLVLDHKFSPDLMAYASLTRGYQAGGFNTTQVNSLLAPEHVTNAELGIKGALPKQGLSYSAALFAYRFSNLQTLELVEATTPGGVPNYQVTSSDQKATGVDLEARWQINRQWRLSGALEYINQRYQRARGTDGADLSGKPVGTPKFSSSWGVDHQTALWGGTLNSGLQFAYTSAWRCTSQSEIQGECLTTPTWHFGGPKRRWDARMAWDSAPDSAGRTWGLGLTINNLSNEHTIGRLWYEPAPFGAAYATLNRPRSIAMELRAGY